MNSILTMEERTLLQSLGCKDKAQAIAVLNSIKMDMPVRSELFANAVTLENKLENEKVDFAAEMAEIDVLEDDEIT